MSLRDFRHIKGLSALQKFLDQLPAKMERNVMRGALRAAANVTRDQARSNIASKSGQLAAGIKVSTSAKGGTITASVRARGPHGYIAHMVEFGTKPHFISVAPEERGRNRRTGRALSMRTVNRRVLAIGATFIGPTVHHPGSSPHPFMRPAADQTATTGARAAAEYTKRRLATKHGLDTSGVDLGDEQ